MLFYLIVRFGFTPWLDGLGEYSSYLFEGAIVALSITLNWKKFSKLWNFPKVLILFGCGSLLFGFLTFKEAQFFPIQIPIDFSSVETLLFLLLVAPLLEELIFRFFIWQPLSRINTLTAYLGTSAIFSCSHFHSFWFVPTEFHPFIYYQTIYTFFLALACGYSVWKFKSLSGAIWIHFGFNLGFYLGFALAQQL